MLSAGLHVGFASSHILFVIFIDRNLRAKKEGRKEGRRVKNVQYADLRRLRCRLIAVKILSQTLQRQPDSLEFLEDVSLLLFSFFSSVRWGLLAFNLCGVDKTLSESFGGHLSRSVNRLWRLWLFWLHRPVIKMPRESSRTVWDASQRWHVSGRSTLVPDRRQRSSKLFYFHYIDDHVSVSVSFYPKK